MSRTYFDVYREWLPPRYNHPIFEALVLCCDTLTTWLKGAVKEHHIDTASKLDARIRERSLLTYRGETEASKRARLIAMWESRSFSGTAYALETALAAAGITAVVRPEWNTDTDGYGWDENCPALPDDPDPLAWRRGEWLYPEFGATLEITGEWNADAITACLQQWNASHCQLYYAVAHSPGAMLIQRGSRKIGGHDWKIGSDPNYRAFPL